ncbi:MAG: GNAT family N-acetyltransferase [Cytophagales bacterium]|nr:MAG: GNAT family N-acetyltransferase [Cytophagales bacterium]
MKIRKANLNDLDQLSKLFDAYRGFYKYASDIASAKDFLYQRMVNKESEIFVAENEDFSIAGFVQLYPLFSSTRLKRLWLLNDLFVNEAYRGKKYGELLIEEVKKFAKTTISCGFILETEKKNLIGNNLYLKVGLNLDKEHNFYFWDNEE